MYCSLVLLKLRISCMDINKWCKIPCCTPCQNLGGACSKKDRILDPINLKFQKLRAFSFQNSNFSKNKCVYSFFVFFLHFAVFLLFFIFTFLLVGLPFPVSSFFPRSGRVIGPSSPPLRSVCYCIHSVLYLILNNIKLCSSNPS